ncbi:MAG: hypothetical protein ACRYG8_43995 [Janthinobacterium lividum]
MPSEGPQTTDAKTHPPKQVADLADAMNRLLGDLGLGAGSISQEDAQRIITEVERGR